jgi:hypothetical protein
VVERLNGRPTIKANLTFLIDLVTSEPPVAPPRPSLIV